jgi:hypothetical protein
MRNEGKATKREGTTNAGAPYPGFAEELGGVAEPQRNETGLLGGSISATEPGAPYTGFPVKRGWVD